MIMINENWEQVKDLSDVLRIVSENIGDEFAQKVEEIFKDYKYIGGEQMRRLINYIRSCFCKHDWECIAKNIARYESEKQIPYERIWIYRCKKCGCRNKITTK